MCAWLAEECKMPLDRRQRSGHTALHKAADCGQKDAIEYLLGHLSADQLRRVGLCADEEIVFTDQIQTAAGDEPELVVTRDAAFPRVEVVAVSAPTSVYACSFLCPAVSNHIQTSVA